MRSKVIQQASKKYKNYNLVKSYSTLERNLEDENRKIVKYKI